MKKIITILTCFICVGIVACKKQKQTPDVQKGELHKLTLNVADFTQLIMDNIKSNKKVNNVSAKTTTATANVNLLYYKIFDANNNAVFSQKQSSDQPGFGSFNTSLANGTYTIAVIGTKTKPPSTTDSEFIVHDTYFYYSIPDETYYYGPTDTFFKKFSVTISGGAVIKDIALERIIAQLEVYLDYDVRTLEYYISDEKIQYSILNDMPNNVYRKSPFWYAAEKYNGSINTHYVINVLNTNSPLKVSVVINIANDNTTFRKHFTVQCKKNVRTVLKGTLNHNSNQGNTQYNISFDTAYSDSLITHF